MKIRGTMKEVKPIEFLQERVYIRKNITRIDEDGEDGFCGWEYEETEVALSEYLVSIEMLGQQITSIMLEVV